MQIMRIIETTARNWWPEASWTGDNDLPGVLRTSCAIRKAQPQDARGHVGMRGAIPGCTESRNNHRSDEEGVDRGTIIAMHDLQSPDAQTGGYTASGRNRAYMRKTCDAAPTTWPGEENGHSARKTASAGCL